MSLLIKFPSRERPAKFLSVLKMYRDSLVLLDTSFLVTIDADDKSMNNHKVLSALDEYDNVKYVVGESKGKIHACNRDLERVEFDVLLLASDDMIPQVSGIDKIIMDHMKEKHPSGDGALWFNDGYTRNLINTIVCLDKKYYDRFGYLYHPAYNSLFSDNEYTIVGTRLKKLVYINQVILKHEHPIRIGTVMDDLYRKNEGMWKWDEATFRKRQRGGFK